MLESQVAGASLGRSLHRPRFEHSGMVADLDNAVSTFKEASILLLMFMQIILTSTELLATALCYDLKP